MNRTQRRAHARLWPALLLVLVAIVVVPLLAKSAIDRAGQQPPAMRIKKG